MPLTASPPPPSPPVETPEAPVSTPSAAAPIAAAPSRRWLVGLIALFLLSSLAVLPLLTRYRGDERFYTDAAIGMLRTGDWITPTYADGQPRFRKPILPYWLVAVPFRTLGVGVVTSRLGSMLAATVALLLTYRLAMRLTRDARASVLAVAALASSVQMLNMATRATTDALQTASATLALLGLAGLAFAPRGDGGRPHARHQVAFWLGVGLVAASKGGLALLILAFAVTFLLWRGRHLGVRLRDLVHWPSIVVAAVLSFGWFAAVLLRHGHLAWHDFWSDQVGSRLSGHRLGSVFQNLWRYVSSVPVELLPWALLLALAAFGQKRTVRSFFAEHREQAAFAGLWWLLLLVTFTVGNIQRTRYLLPTYPAIAAIGAALLVRLWDDAGARSRQANVLLALLVAAAAVTALLGALGWRIDPLVSAGGAATAAVAIVAWVAIRRDRADDAGAAFRHAIVWAMFLIAANRLNDLLTRQPLFPPAGPDIVRAAEAAGARRIAAIGVAPGQLAQARLLTGGTLRLDPVPIDTAPEALLAQYDAILYSASLLTPPTLPPGATTMPAGANCTGFRGDDIAAVCLGLRSKRDVFARTSTPLTLARYADGSAHPTNVPATQPAFAQPKESRSEDDD